MTLKIAITADLHWGTHRNGDEATGQLVAFLEAQPPDLLILAGDVGAGAHLGPSLELFHHLGCFKTFVPGNHDIWVKEDDRRGDSLQVYRQHLPKVGSEHGFLYLDQDPLFLPDHQLAIVGSINWYDYSWSLELLREQTPDYEERLRTKRFSRGRHNDARFVRWPIDDRQFTAAVTRTFEEHLDRAIASKFQVLAVTHHPPFYGLNWLRSEPATLDGLLWEAFSGNKTLEGILARHAAHIPFIFCGHTHRARENTFEGIRGYNVGGDYHFKRLLLLDWPAGTVTAHTFGEP